MSQFFDAMTDIECMGTSQNAALVSIGARFFDIKSETLGPSFERTIHLGSSVANGGVIEPGAVLFWLRQPDAARHAIAYGGEPINRVLIDFSDWIAKTCRHQDVRVWGNSAAFDCGILGSAYDRLGMTRPWYWSNERCFRSIRNWYPSVPYDPSEKGDGAHNALADADFQIAHLLKIKNRVKAKQ